MSDQFYSLINIFYLEFVSDQAIQLCYHCHKCMAGCPVADQMDYGPDRILRMVQLGEKDAKKIISKMSEMIKITGKITIDYVAIVNKETLEPVKNISGKTLVVLAVRLGKTRLIDNILI